MRRDTGLFPQPVRTAQIETNPVPKTPAPSGKKGFNKKRRKRRSSAPATSAKGDIDWSVLVPQAQSLFAAI